MKAARPLVWRKGAELKDESRRYCYEGRRYESVTSFLSPLFDASFPARTWFGQEVTRLAQAWLDGEAVEAWQESGCGWAKTSASPPDLLTDKAYVENIALRELKRHSDRGGAIDDLFNEYAQGAAPSLEQLPEYLESVIFGKGRSCSVEECLPFGAQAIRFLETYQPSIYFSQVPVFHDGYRYAGTFDHVISTDGALASVAPWTSPFALLSVKTTNSEGAKMDRSWQAQEGAYALADFGVVEGGSCPVEVELPPKMDALYVILHKDRYYLRHASRSLLDRAVRELFLPLVQIAQAQASLPLAPIVGKAKRGAAVPA